MSGTARSAVYHSVSRHRSVAGQRSTWAKLRSLAPAARRLALFDAPLFGCGRLHGRRLEHEPDAANRLEQWHVLVVCVELATQTTCVHIDDVRIRISWIVPHVLQQLGAPNDSPRVAGEIHEERELLRGERKRTPMPVRGVPADIDRQVADHERL